MKRREFIGSIVAAPALVGLTRKSPRAIAGGFVDDGGARGHTIRDGRAVPSAAAPQSVGIVVVGGGMAGLCAGWELDRKGFRDFTILEFERDAGGNARSGENDVSAYPWAAHYVPVPGEESVLVRELFTELGLFHDGEWEERHLCFSPQERLFMHGEWHPGIEPEFALDSAGREAFRRFDDAIAKMRQTGGFTIPMERGASRSSPLDRMSMSEWMRQQGITHPAIDWYVNYACRDDYGALAKDTSAWAGVHYFASREHDEQGPLTWPDGNGWIAKRLIAKLSAHIRTSDPVVRIEQRGSKWLVATTSRAFVADGVIFAAPSFLAPHIVASATARAIPLTYSPWLTANLTLDRPPQERGKGAPLSWDNVLYDSPALGYVDATHQSLRTHQERSVWTYYWSLAEHAPSDGRKLLLTRTWAEWTAIILDDLARAHPDIRECVSRIDIMRMGHAMVRPVPGFLSDTASLSSLERPGFYLANSDLSGLSLFEEAQFRGVTAAQKALARIGKH